MKSHSKLISFFLPLLLLLALSCSVKKPCMALVGYSLTSSSIYIYNDTISHDKDLISAVIKTVPAGKTGPLDEKPAYKILREIQEKEFGDYSHTEALWQVKCADSTYRIQKFTIHYKDARQPLTTDSADAEWEKALHGSSAEMVIDHLCR